MGDGRASVGKDCVVVRASGGGVVVRVLAGVSEWLRACWLARQLPVVKSKTHSPPGKQARLASHQKCLTPHRNLSASERATPRL